MRNQKEIDRICDQECKTDNLRWYIGAITVILSLIAISTILLSIRAAWKDQITDQAMGARVVITLMTWAVLAIGWYLWDRALERKMGRLWERKKTFLS